MNLTEKDKKYLIVLGVVVGLAVLYVWGYKPLKTKRDNLKAECVVLKNHIQTYKEKLESQDFYHEAIEEITQKRRALDERLPQVLSQEWMIGQIDDLSDALGIKLPVIHLSEIQRDENDGEDKAIPRQMKASVMTATTCSYDVFKQLLQYRENLPIVTALDHLSIQGEGTALNVAFTLYFYGLEVPERNEEANVFEVYPRGKNNLFSTKQSSATKKTRVNDDLFLIIDPVQADNEAITLGSTKDTTRRTYLYEESNEPSDIVFDFTQSQNTYYVQYRIGNQYYPSQDSKMVFNPLGTIGIKVYSSQRLNANDLNEAHVKILNKTDKEVRIQVINDDKNRPRFHLLEKEGVVEVIKE